MTASELATILKARKHGNYWLARCVVHRDRSPSVSIRQGKDRVMLKCFAGCECKDILTTLGLSFNDLGYKSEPEWRHRIRLNRVQPSGKRKPLGELEATYRYTDERGELLAEKLRFEGKVFLWRRPNGGGWIWKVDRAKLPLYLLHEVVLAPTVALCEGEKDAERLRKLGFTATTAPNGANSWRAGFAQHFSGKKVLIFPDSDAPGIDYAERAQRDIEKVAAVKVFMLPAKDVSDYLDSHSKDEFRSILNGRVQK